VRAIAEVGGGLFSGQAIRGMSGVLRFLIKGVNIFGIWKIKEFNFKLQIIFLDFRILLSKIASSLCFDFAGTIRLFWCSLVRNVVEVANVQCLFLLSDRWCHWSSRLVSKQICTVCGLSFLVNAAQEMLPHKMSNSCRPAVAGRNL